MHKNDWSLIIFTLLTQMSVGIIFVLTVLNFYQPSLLQSFPDGIVMLSPHFIALAAIVVATVISFLHLGYPAHAFNSANNLTTSWLSREILGIGLFGASVLLIFLQFWLGWDGVLFQKLVLVFGATSGLMLIYFMARIYMVKTIPAWNTWFTPFHFFMSSFILGGLVVAGFLLKDNDSLDFVRLSLRIIALLLVLQLIATFFFKKNLVKNDHQGISPPDFRSETYHTLYEVRLFIILISALFAAYLSLRVNYVEVNFAAVIRFYAFVCLLILTEETIGRFMFYAGYYRIGV